MLAMVVFDAIEEPRGRLCSVLEPRVVAAHGLAIRSAVSLLRRYVLYGTPEQGHATNRA